MAKSKNMNTQVISLAQSSPCIASYALCCSEHDSQDKFPQVFHFIEHNVYMDDLYISTANVESSVSIMKNTKSVSHLVVSTSRSEL